MTFSYVSRLEAGGTAPGIDLVERLAAALGAHVADLLPFPQEAGAADGARRRVRAEFDAMLPAAGPDTLHTLGVLVARLAESPGADR